MHFSNYLYHKFLKIIKYQCISITFYIASFSEFIHSTEFRSANAPSIQCNGQSGSDHECFSSGTRNFDKLVHALWPRVVKFVLAGKHRQMPECASLSWLRFCDKLSENYCEILRSGLIHRHRQLLFTLSPSGLFLSHSLKCYWPRPEIIQ